MSSKNTGEECLMYSKCDYIEEHLIHSKGDNIEIMIHDKADEAIEELLKQRL